MTGALRTTCFALIIAATAVAARAQQPDFTGTWVLDRTASQIVRDAGLSGLGAGGAPDTLHVTHGSSGTIVIGSEVNESQSRLYRVNGKSEVPYPDGTAMPVQTKLQGPVLYVDGAAASGALKEVHTLSADRQMLTIVINVASAKIVGRSTLVYRRTTKAAPCQSWPTPCR